MSREPRTKSIAKPGDIIINGVVVIVCVRPPKLLITEDGAEYSPGLWALPGGRLTAEEAEAQSVAEAIAYRRIDGPRIAG
jgi:ADP-ribose pyrophosphatase YjhB (NUDIX family)